MKLVQLNIWQGRLIEKVLHFLEQEQPDFMCFQEVYNGDITTRSHDFLASFNQIKAKFPNYHGYFSPWCDIPVFDQKVQYGNALLSRYPLIDKDTIFTQGEYHSFQMVGEYAELEGQEEPYNVQRVTMQIDDGKSFCLMNHHGYWEPDRIGSERSVEMMQKVADIIKTSPRPLIFAGDLNVVSESPAMQPIQELLRDLTKEYKLQTTLSELSEVKDVACDHISISEGVEPRLLEISNVLDSDHRALVMQFDLKYRLSD